MKRSKLSLVIATVLTAVLASPAIAVTADATPESQTHAYGQQSSWNGQWTGVSPYDVVFYFGDGLSDNRGSAVTYHSTTFHHTYYPCVGTTFTAHLNVWEWDNDFPAIDYVTATEGGGNPC
jgi:hypothetical protein